MLRRSDVAEFELERGGTVLRVRRALGVAPGVAGVVAPAPAPIAPAVAPPPPASGLAAPTADHRPAAEPEGAIVTSPFVGTFYRSPAPDAPAYVDVGSAVRKGQVLCIVEAMKLMNEIESEVDGRVARIYAENAQPVEYGAPLFLVVPT
ncbi:acetyl-CoA carboxylase biotin carboxyl carrier protein [Myxococcota bacterium]|nr:acetyl-CoA carboxylase biotin carboxyl carrier protein [Myxococcota bacterium]